MVQRRKFLPKTCRAAAACMWNTNTVASAVAREDSMGNTTLLRRVADYLGDPFLVRRIQERLGVKQIADAPPRSLPPPSPPDAKRDSAGLGGKVAGGGASSAANGLVNGYKWLSSKTRKRVKTPDSTSPASSPEPADMVVETFPLLNIFFRLASELGHKPFYITYFPFLIWNADTSMGRHTAVLWCFSMYVGQACKVLFKWKRPACPPAIRLVTNSVLETEYGLPSTHATGATTVPFYSLYFLHHRYNLSLWCGLPVALFWCVSVCLSRVYLGVHTVLDVLAGLLIAIVMLLLCLPAIPCLDWFVFDFEYTLIAAPLIVIVLLYIYPVETDKWSMNRGDTAAILGVGLGTILGFHLYGRFPEDIGPGPFQFSLPSLQVVGLSLVRFVVGVLLLLPTRFIMKLLCFRLLPLIMPTHGVQEVVKRPLVELPYKIITYSMISLNVSFFSVYVFELCNISRF